jgi:hypothetical protein
MRPWLFALVVCAFVAACAPATRLTAVWAAPEARALKFNRILVVAQSPDTARRRALESAIVSRIENASPSYDVLTNEQARDRDRARMAVQQGGYDAVVVVRFVGVDTQMTYVPGTTYWGPAPYASLWGYWGYGWGSVYQPGYLQADEVVTLETNVYALPADDLLWSSRSETISPSSIDTLVDSVVDATVAEMRRRRVL